jgi:hypothetical protein
VAFLPTKTGQAFLEGPCVDITGHPNVLASKKEAPEREIKSNLSEDKASAPPSWAVQGIVGLGWGAHSRPES